MSELSLNDFKKKLKAGDIGSLYILCGDESYLKEHYLQQLRRAVLGAESTGDDFNLRRFDGRSLELDSLIEAVEAYPSFAEKAFVEVRDYDIFRASEEASSKLIALLNNMPDYCCLTFIYDTLEYKPDKRKKLSSVIDARADVISISQQEQSDLIKWISLHFKSHGKTISADDASYLIFLCGGLMNGLKNEIDKIAFYAKGINITRADIDSVASPVIEAVIFDLTNELSRKNYDKAAGIMGRLFQLDEEPIRILSVIAGQIRKLYSARLIKETGTSGTEQAVQSILKLASAYQARLLYKGCTDFSERWYKENLKLCAETDLKMKSTGEDPKELLTTLFLFMANNRM
jgi:DNA polymerase-3 subunit delta